MDREKEKERSERWREIDREKEIERGREMEGDGWGKVERVGRD
jgi:hypothetical protein